MLQKWNVEKDKYWSKQRIGDPQQYHCAENKFEPRVMNHNDKLIKKHPQLSG